VATLATGSAATASEQAKFNPPKSYYLALGDSVTFGFQSAKWFPGAAPTMFDTGYVDVFAARLRLIRPGITTVNYGCPGESTESFLTGPCLVKAAGLLLHDDYVGAQVEAAMAFLRSHPGDVSPITLTLWGNDVRIFTESCAGDIDCIQNGAPAVIARFAANLATILHQLRAAAPDAEIIVTGAWSTFIGAFDVADPLIMALNDEIARTVTSQRARFADVFPVFNPQGDPVAETAAICALTLLCTQGDSHPSDAGYHAISDAVFDVSGYARLGT
jgi:lysophospholipase L1-like esterase